MTLKKDPLEKKQQPLSELCCVMVLADLAQKKSTNVNKPECKFSSVINGCESLGKVCVILCLIQRDQRPFLFSCCLPAKMSNCQDMGGSSDVIKYGKV